MQRVIIIGATSGIGKGLAELFAGQNDLVGITGRRVELLDALQHRFPGNIFTEPFDVTGENIIPHLESLIAKLGGLDLLIYNSGYGEPSTSLDWAIDRQTIGTNVNGFTAIVNYAFNYFQRQGHGQIAAVSSIASVRGSSYAPAYSASKAFMSNYLEGLAIRAKKLDTGIIITDILPGFVRTKMAKGNKQFWVAPAGKAVRQIFNAIKAKKRKVYVTKRWWLIAKLMKHFPFWLYRRLG